jgi:ribosomal protein L9
MRYELVACTAQDIPAMGLFKYEVARVSPGAARNHFVPNNLAVYAHYLNKQRFAAEIAAASSSKDAAAVENVMELKESIRDARMLKRLSTLKLVCNLAILQSFS